MDSRGCGAIVIDMPSDLFARVEQLEAAIARTTHELSAVSHEVARVEAARDRLRPVRPYANSLFAYFSTPQKLPPVPVVPDESDVAAVRTVRPADGNALGGAAYRNDADAARARIEALQRELDDRQTRLARAQQRLDRAERELTRRRDRARLDDRFSAKETLQVVALLAAVLGGGIALSLVGIAIGTH